MKTMTATGWGIKVALVALVACSAPADPGNELGGWAGEPVVDPDPSTGGAALAIGGRPAVRPGGDAGAPPIENTGGVPQAGGAGGSVATGGGVATGGAVASGGVTQTGGSDGSGGDPPCQEARWYLDADGDGYGDPGAWVEDCEAPPGYVANGDDCYDDNSDARPGQTGRFTSHRGDGSFDYDCSGKAELHYPDFAQCPDFEEYDDHACPPANLWPAGYDISYCRPDPSHPQCYCDYYAMSDRFHAAREGWRPFLTYQQCAPGRPDLCPVVQPLPKCGETGTWGVSITWNDPAHRWECRDSGDLGATSRRQSCR